MINMNRLIIENVVNGIKNRSVRDNMEVVDHNIVDHKHKCEFQNMKNKKLCTNEGKIVIDLNCKYNYLCDKHYTRVQTWLKKWDIQY